MKKQMLNTLSSDVVLLAGGNQAANCPIPDISPAPPPDYHALLCHPNDFEFSVNGCYVRIWNAAGCLELNREYHIALYLPQALAIGDDGGGGLFLYMTEQQGWGLYTAAPPIWTQPKRRKLPIACTDCWLKGGVERSLPRCIVRQNNNGTSRVCGFATHAVGSIQSRSGIYARKPAHFKNVGHQCPTYQLAPQPFRPPSFPRRRESCRNSSNGLFFLTNTEHQPRFPPARE